ncbi:MAG: ABC transporter ATP-binding protein/permease [Treponema sp.]|nr:ABC transporter ATP-binding protein/permease [Treponema sp.]MCL2272202.1 ABC transporter ATP-binding protein/permease [Treponema sp.]
MKPPPEYFKEYRTLLPYLMRYRNQYILGIICLVICDAAQIIIPQFLRVVIDLIGSGDFQWRRIIILSLLMVGMTALVSSGRFLWRYFLNGSSRRIETQLREDIYDHLQKLSWDFYQKNKIGDLMARSINDLHAVRMAIGMGFVAFFDFIFMATAILIIIFIQDAQSAFYSIIPLPVITLLILLFGGFVGKKFRTVHEAYSSLSDNVQETFAGMGIIKSFVKEWWFIKKFSDSNDDYRKANMELVRLFGFFFPFIQFLSGLTIIVMLFIGGIRVVNDQMTPGSLVAMFRYLGMLIWPLMGAGFMVNMIQRGKVALGRINEILQTEPSIFSINYKLDRETEKKMAGENDTAALELENLHFTYNKEKKNALERINFRVNRGEWLGIMGKTGSGKSTLIKTFTRTVDPPPCTVRVFGLDIREWPLDQLRSLFAVSPQDSYLFSDTIANNIAYGYTDSDTSAKAKAISKAIDFACFNKDLENFQNGKDTLVGERGLTLSGGQKQRTAIARAAIMDAEFLILDDSLSAVDNETEFKILEALRKERINRTTIIISHRVSTLKYADKVLVLENGRMAEYGKPADLANAGGFYSRMTAFQRLEHEPEKESG